MFQLTSRCYYNEPCMSLAPLTTFPDNAMKTFFATILIGLLGVTLAFGRSSDIRLKIKDADSGNPLSRVSITLLEHATPNHQSIDVDIQDDGIYYLRHVPFGKYDIELSLNRYRTRKLEGIHVERDSLDLLTISLKQLKPEHQPVTMDISPDAKTGAISGQVHDIHSGEPLANANVYLQNTPFGTGTDANGKFALNDIPGGYYTLVISYIGFEKIVIDSFNVQPDTTITLSQKLKMGVLE